METPTNLVNQIEPQPTHRELPDNITFVDYEISDIGGDEQEIKSLLIFTGAHTYLEQGEQFRRPVSFPLSQIVEVAWNLDHYPSNMRETDCVGRDVIYLKTGVRVSLTLKADRNALRLMFGLPPL